MKRIACLMLIVSLLLTGCGFLGERIHEPVLFYYLCQNYQKELCCVIVSEEREVTGHSGDIPYLLALYELGPAGTDYRSPLPSGTQIDAELRNGKLQLELSEKAIALSDSEFSLACACLTMTFLDVGEIESVTLCCGERKKTMTRDSLSLYDTAEIISPTEEYK